MSYRHIVLTLALVIGIASMPKAQAAWGDIYCDILNGNGTALEKAIDLYNQSDSANRACKKAVRIFGAQTLAIPNGLAITKTPADGATYGLAIRRCVSSGPNAEGGCSGMSDNSAVIDASGYTADGGDCPIKISNGVKMDFIKIKLIAPNPEKAICTSEGEPVPVEDTQNPYAWIHGVTIVGKNGQPPVTEEPTCQLTSTPIEAGYRLDWSTEHAASAQLKEGIAVIDTDLSGMKEVHPSSETVYTLSATGAGGNCEKSVTIRPETPETQPTCDLTVVPAENGYNINWVTQHATEAAVSDGVQVLSTQLNNAGVPLHVEPSSETTYRLTATGLGGSCQDEVTITPEPVAIVPTCDIAATIVGETVELRWVTTDATTASVSDGTLDLATDLISQQPLVITPTQTTTYTLTASGTGGQCTDTVTIEVEGGPIDTDGDGIADADDNCPTVSNDNQADTDGDDVGDACDDPVAIPTDTDGDGVADEEDNCPVIANPKNESGKQPDDDEDGVGNDCDPDFSGSGEPGTKAVQGCGCRLDAESRPWDDAETVQALLGGLALAFLAMGRRRKPPQKS